jgi:hypothetical protein
LNQSLGEDRRYTTGYLMNPELFGELEGFGQNAEMETVGFSGKYNSPTRLHGVKTQKREPEACSMQEHTAI